jgi:rSAM/selenodomain-associated transferase 2
MHELKRPSLSIIIPTLNEAGSVGSTLAALTHMRPLAQVIIVDGGSIDDTREIAHALGAEVITSKRGRGVQMHIGSQAAQGDVLCFLHADTILPNESIELINEALRNPQVVAGNFDVRFDGPRAAARFMSWLYPRLCRFGLTYGDSAIFVRREAYERIGGFKALPIFEDLDLVRRLRRIGRFAHLPTAVVTSSRRFEGRSFVITFIRWIAMQSLYWVGVHPRSLARFYAPVRGNRKD